MLKHAYSYQDRLVKNCVDLALEDLLAMGDYDMRIATNGELIGVHRLVLMLFSTTCRDVLSKLKSENLVYGCKYTILIF